jgi:hypothetical protein
MGGQMTPKCGIDYLSEPTILDLRKNARFGRATARSAGAEGNAIAIDGWGMTMKRAIQSDQAETSGPRDPESTEDAISLFSDPDYCIEYLVFRRWPNGRVMCPQCSSSDVIWLARRRMWQCKGKHPQAQFSVRAGTFLEDSRIGLCQWLLALWLIAERDLKISSYEVARRIGITQKSAWLMMKRIRRVMDLSGISSGHLAGGSSAS